MLDSLVFFFFFFFNDTATTEIYTLSLHDALPILREEIGAFVEVYVKASLDECIRRDTKGLYARALAGEIAQFTGVRSEEHTSELQSRLHLVCRLLLEKKKKKKKKNPQNSL